MGIKDAVTKDYMADPIVFADAFNYLLYDGRQVIRPEQLHRKDTAARALPYGKGGSTVGVQRYRDNLKSWVMMEDDGMAYLILGIESQSQQHLAMPVRNMLYDAWQYA